MPVDLHINIVGAEMVRKGLEDFSREIPRIGRQTIYNTLVRARTRLKAPVPRPSYPINWDSEKQRRAFFASNGFGRGIPTRRTGRYKAGWVINKTGDAAYELVNDTEGAVYIGGDFAGRYQSQIHQGRYPLANDVLAEEIEKLPSEIENNISSEAQRIFV